VSRSTTGYFIRMSVTLVSLIFIAGDLNVSAQNANSSTTTTMQEGAPVENTNTSNNVNMNRGRRGRRRRRGGSMNAGDAPVSTTTQPRQEFITDRPVQMPAQAGRCDPMAQEQTDLSGTYTGTVNYAEGGLSGDTTLTINGNRFTMTSGSSEQEGRVVAVTTCNYTAVTMMFGKEQVSAASGPQPQALPVVSLRAKRVAGRLSLESTEGETRQFSFTSVAAGGGRARATRPARKRSGKPSGPAIPVGIKPPTAMSHAR
jgi:hypothetical protein